ncbi:hypothetical protein E2C01_048379 [Portunus trituberculatus]|uniref:BESS domain-containing protein n=1 Tax=Portunus trituberculatus TaxID=210409 RepID=A0A5B7G698_PORTR|nr:hypothetical protein [Portunus trituberculatus]
MDVELLIAKVYERQPVWNKWNKQHAKRNVVDKMWAEISHELKCEVSDETARRYPTPYGTSSELIIPDLRIGLRPGTHHTPGQQGVLTSHAVVTSLPKSPQVRYQMATVEPTLGTEEDASSSHTKDIHERKDEVREKQWFTSPATRRKKKGASKRSKTDDYNHSILDIEQQRIKYLKEKINHKEDKEDDEDQMFFKSLLPHVKRIPAVQKLTFRSRLQELVQQFAYPVPEISPLPDTHDSSSSASAYTAQVSP